MFYQMIEKSRQINPFICHKLKPRFDLFLSLLKTIEEELGENLLNEFTHSVVRKGDYLLREGEVARSLWFLKEGAARRYFYNDGGETTIDFFFDHEIIDIFDSSSLGIPSRCNVQMLSDGEILAITWEAFDRLALKYPIFHRLERLMLGCYVHDLEQRHFAHLEVTATERYKQLLVRQPYLVHQIPLTYLASYLGIELSSLSRIRKNLSPEK